MDGAERDLTDLQRQLLDRLKGKQGRPLTEWAWLMQKGRLAVYSAARALERRGLVCMWRHGDGAHTLLYVAERRA